MAITRFAAALALLSGVLSGCGAPQPIGDSGMISTYDLGYVRTTLPSAVSPLTALAAAESVVDARGWVMVGRYTSDERSRLRAKFAGGSVVEEYQITCSSVAQGTLVEIFVSPFGDRARGELLLRDMLAVLGLDSIEQGLHARR